MNYIRSDRMNEIDARLFRYFAVLAEQLHFGRAADQLKISASTLTQQIQRLESLVGVSLVSRSRRGLVLTDAGNRFLLHARDALRNSEEAIVAARGAARGEIGRVELACLMTPICAGWLQKLITEFEKIRPRIEVNIRFMKTLAQVQSILDGTIDVGLAAVPKNYPLGLKGRVVITEPLVAVLPARHPLARTRKSIAPNVLKNEKFIFTSIETEMGYERITDIIGRAGRFTPTIVKRVPDMFSVFANVSAGYGISVVPQSLGSMKIANLVYRTFLEPEKVPYPLAFLYRSSENSPAKRVFIDFVARYKWGGL